ncbi:serine protease 40-like [Neovison vison]|uniref:serine protease 40-like n=1 Tax=Neovison vison TaxID=452646 RepID=UPI001CF0D513|nr:serine protease 40-like [Neogale vison]
MAPVALLRWRWLHSPSISDSLKNIRPGHMSHEPSDYRILLGYHRLQHPTEHSQQMTVYRLIVHNEFNKHYFMGSDITLLQLHLSLLGMGGPREDVRAAHDNHTPGGSCHCDTVLPHANTSQIYFLAPPFQLQEGEVGIIDSEVCKIYFQSPDSSSSEYSIHEDMFCAGDLMTGKSICQRDSGGPLVCKLNSCTWFLMGLSIWSQACHYPISPSVFTRITYFSNWISEKQSTSPNPHPSLAPPQEKPPILSDFTSLGTVHKPTTYITLVSSQTFLLLLISLRTL